MYDDEQSLTEPSSFAALGAMTVAVKGTELPALVDDREASPPLRPTFLQQFGRLIRYGATSGIALGVSEITLVILYASRTFDATNAAIVANLAGTIPSYLLSRFWIWSDSDRKRVGRQVVLYWMTSIISMVITSFATGAIASASPVGHKTHVAIAGLGFLGVNLVLWVAKYFVYQRIIFRPSKHVAELIV